MKSPLGFGAAPLGNMKEVADCAAKARSAATVQPTVVGHKPAVAESTTTQP
jgi:hypothetical protein